MKQAIWPERETAYVYWLPAENAAGERTQPDDWDENKRFWRDIKREILLREAPDRVYLGKLY